MGIGTGTYSQTNSITIPSDFHFDPELASAFHEMEFTQNSLFLTGRAGTGKSTLLNYFRKNTIKKYVVLAPTGLAALQVGGVTIHSFFGLPLRPLIKNDPEIKAFGKGHPRLRILKKMDTLIIDEVSMVRVDIMDAMDHSLRLNMGNNIPFGGKQVIFIGDVFQLPPVVKNDEPRYSDDDEYYSPYFFSADAFRACRPSVIELKKIYRQTDDDFIYLLNRIRMGIANADDLAVLNQRYTTATGSHDEFAITLAPINALADRVNEQRLMEIIGEGFEFTAKVEGVFPERLFPVSHRLRLKKGAQVMMVKNDLQGKWVNGSIGKIDELARDEIVVRFADGSRHKIDPVSWENKTYTWDKASNSINFAVQGTFTQYPIRLAWSVTIHKSQGLTFDRVIIDLGRGAFAHGQLYVALSRCRTLNGITLRSPIQPKDMIVDESVERFAARCNLGR